MTRHPLQPMRQPAALGALHRASRAMVGLAAAILLLALLAGVPYGLARGVGWPLPHHMPTLTEIKTTLTGPFTDQILLDTLACLCWLVWAIFLADTIGAMPEAIHRARATLALPRPRTLDHADGPRAGPLRGLAAVLLAAIVTGLLSLRPHPALLAGGASAGVATSRPTVVATSLQADTVAQPGAVMTAQVMADRATGTSTVTVQVQRDGIHDSLWRIAQRCLGAGARWPEIYRLNQGLPQPDGGVLTSPSLIQPGWILRLPTTTRLGGSGSSSNHAPPPSTRPRTSHTPTPPPAPTVSSVPNTPTTRPLDTPAPSSPAPVSPAAPSRSASPSSVDRPAVHATGRGGGVDLGDGVFVSLGLAGAISAAVVTERRRRRVRYVPGSGRRDDLLPLAPVVRTLHLAHLRATGESATPSDADADTDVDADADTDVDVEADGAAPHWQHGQGGGGVKIVRSHRQASRGPEVGGAAFGRTATGVAAGAVDGREVAIDLAGLHGVGLVGPGAAGAARALILHLLAATDTVSGRTPHEVPVLLLPASTASDLQLPDPARYPARLRMVPDLTAALDVAETEMLRHARLATTSAMNSTRGVADALGLVVVTSVPADTRRLQAILDTGGSAGVGAILLGQWRPGTSVYVDADGTVTATSPGPGEPLRGGRLFHLNALETAELLDQLHSADPPTAPTARSVAGSSDQTVGVPVDVAEHQSRSPEAPPRPDEPGVPEPRAVSSPPARSVPSGSAGSVPARDGGAVITADAAAGVATTTQSADRTLVLGDSRELASGIEPAALTLTVLGPVQLTWSPPDPHASPVDETAAMTRDITAALSPRLRELLVLLALHPDGITRDRLADVLWPDTPTGRPFATLNTNLARLRRTIAAATGGRVPEIVLTSGDRHQLDPETVQTDFRVFSDALAARRAASSDVQRATAYRQVVAAYRGELAEGLSAEWLETSREAVRRDAVDAATSLARLLVTTDARAALELLETARAFDPYNEAIYRDIMQLQRRLAQPDAIERTLALLTTRLTELGETPGPETLAFAQRLQSPRSEPAQPTR